MSAKIVSIPAKFARETHLNLAQYQKLYAESIQDPQGFWGEQAEKFISWFEPWDTVLTGSFAEQDVTWFQNGKLNASYNCLDRHLPTRAEQVALIWEGDEASATKKITYAQLHEEVCRFANALKQLGVKKGDHVCIYMPMIPEAVVAILACVRIGAVHSIVFGGFSADALKTRIDDAECKIVITASAGFRGQKIIPLKKSVDTAVQNSEYVQKVIVVKHTDEAISWLNGRDLWYHEIIAEAAPLCEPEIMDAEDPLFILYTSGSTGKPKGILHTHGGYLVFAAMTFYYIFDYHDQEIYWCTADIGWITGHTYTVYGPLLNGGTTLIFEGTPTYPTFARYWEVIDRYQVDIFYTSPTAIRALRREGDEWVKKTSRRSLKILGSVGEPINPEVWEWYFNVVGDGRCPIVDTWWQTETGGILISALPGVTPLVAGAAAWPFFGVVPAIFDDDGNIAAADVMGKLVIQQPWPGIMQTVYKHRERFVKNYFHEFPGNYLTGDDARCDKQGYFWITGRNDDVLKISGHRIGTGEVESALLKLSAIAEAAVVAVPHAIKGEAIYAFVTPKAGIVPSDKLKKALILKVREVIGPIAAPDYVQWTEALPKTRSGKIMRRLLRKIANNDLKELGDTSTLADPQVVENLIMNRIEIAAL
ncbi:MAG: acetate--CoA ligase [Pseudomonadota bacterium]